MKSLQTLVFIILFVTGNFSSCTHKNHESDSHSQPAAIETELANTLEKSLFDDVIEVWYPLNIDTIYGGYLSNFTFDWQYDETDQTKFIVQQTRHVWATSFMYEFYPEKKEFLAYADNGFKFLKDHMWDKEFGGFLSSVNRDGSPDDEWIRDKRIYGQAFAIYGLSQYYRVSKNPEALELVKKQFLWMEEHGHDKEYGGYFEFLKRDGTPVHYDSDYEVHPRDSRNKGYKDFNSSIHLMEAITQLYRIWPDPLVKERLEEMFYLIRDTFTHPDGYLQLWYHPDWTLVTDEELLERSGSRGHATNHFTYGHDVETAYLLLETADVLGLGEDNKTHQIAKRLVDHSIESGWDDVNGGFYDAGKLIDGKIEIINDHKSWWSIIEGFNALILMHQLYPDDPNNYYEKFEKSWTYIDTYLVDKEHGGWYTSGLDKNPKSKERPKSYDWKTTYHNVRGMVNCTRQLRGTYSHH